jgi:acetylornithine deacetylase
MSLPIDPHFLQTTLSRLVQINSTNPLLSPDGVGEAEIAAYVADVMRGIGLAVQTWEIAPGRWNVVGRLVGTGNGRSLMWNAHMDTVGVQGMAEPFSGAVRDGLLYGRGSYDMKGSLAAMLVAAKGLVDGGVQLAGDLLVTAVADEEHSSLGADHLVRHITADAAIVTEPTDLAICRAHRGFIWYNIHTNGRAAHGSRYQEGIDAIMHMGRFLARLEELEQELLHRPPHSLVGPPSLHAATIRGGVELSVYPADCHLQVERRTIPGETVAQATAELQAILDQLAAADPQFQGTVQRTFDRGPLEVAADATIVQLVEQTATARLGQRPPHIGQSFWTDAAIFAAAGMETMLIGPVGAGLHSAEEWVDVQSVLDLAAILADTAVAYCGSR